MECSATNLAKLYEEIYGSNAITKIWKKTNKLYRWELNLLKEKHPTFYKTNKTFIDKIPIEG